MMLIGAIVLFVLLMASISFYGYRRYAKPGRAYERLAEQEKPEIAETPTGDKSGAKAVLVRIVSSIGEKAPVSPEDASRVRRYLIAAGYRSERAVKIYYGLKILGAVIFFGLAILFRAHLGSTTFFRMAVILAAGAAGFIAPTFILERKIKKRQETLRLSLPDALDLMVVCVEAGLGLDQAILNVSRELQNTHKEISEELGMVTLEMRAGKRRNEALKNLADRTGEPELRKWTATLIQADRFGTSVAESLRTHSEFLRVKRRQDAEERAGKVGVKLVFAVFLFIMPAMLIVAAGPGLLQLFKQLVPLMKSA